MVFSNRGRDAPTAPRISMNAMSTGRNCRTVAAWALLLAARSMFGADPSGAEPGKDRQLAELFAELAAAERAQDRPRLRAAYAGLARLQPANAEIQRGLGLACYLDGAYEAAIAALSRAVGLQSDLPGARLYLGISYYRTNRFADALGELARAPELVAGDPTARYWQGAAHRALGQLPAAIAALESARARADSNPDILQLLARTYAEYSAELFRQLLALAAESAPARLLKAEELALDGADQAALRELSAALAQAPRLIGLRLAKGRLLWSRQDYRPALDEYRRELENDPFSVEAHSRLGEYALENGAPAEALRHLRAARRHAPDDGRLDRLIARALRAAGPEAPGSLAVPEAASPYENSLAGARSAYRRGEAGRAAALLKSLVSTEPGSMEAQRLLVRCYLAEGRSEEAVGQLQVILAGAPNDPEALFLLGKVYERFAAATAERLFELNPDSSSVRLLRGEAFERGPRRDFKRALAEFREAEALREDDPAVQHALGRVLFKMKRFAEAVPHLEAALARNRSHGMANYLLGKIRLAQGDRQGAIRSLRAAIAARPGLADAQRDLAQALVLEGRYDEGIGIYEKLAAGDSADSSLHALMAVAYRRAGRLAEAKAHAELARRLGSAKSQPDEAR